MSAGKGQARDVRSLFEAACDLPPAQWRPRLQSLSDDSALVEEALALLQAQTASFNRALGPLGEMMAALPETELQVGDRLGQWQLVERLASGGMGTVFVAERVDQLFRQRVAIKLLRGAGVAPGVAGRLAEERRILAGLEHPGIARLFDGGTTPSGHPYLVMEYVRGPPLDVHCDTHRLGVRERLELFLRVCRAVQAAHQQLVVHCDLKPSNILVRDAVAPVLLDFGIAQVLGHDGGDDPAAFCTPAYASPEQLSGGHVGVTTDVFSLGVLLTELLARRRTGRGIGDRERPVPLPSELGDGGRALSRQLRGDLDAIAARACALAVADRYPSVEALARDIERHLSWRPVSARARTPQYLAARWMRRNWRFAGAALLVAVLAGAFVWRLGAERDRASREALEAQLVSDFLADAFDVSDPGLRPPDAQGPRARDVLALAETRLRNDPAASPLLRARMQAVLGRAYQNLGQTQRAEPLLAAASEGFLAKDVARADLAGRALGDLAGVLVARQRAGEAVPVARRAVSLLEQAAQPARLADAHAALGMALAARGEFEQAERSLAEANRLHAARSGADARRAQAAIQRSLGYMYRQMGALQRSEQAYAEAVRLARRDGSRRIDLHEGIAGLAATLSVQGRVAEASELYAQRLQLVRELYGEETLALANAHRAMVEVLTMLGRYAQAQAHRGQAVALTSQLAGEQSTEYAAMLEAAALLDQARGDPDNALRLFRRALELRTRLHGRDSGHIWRLESSIGQLLAHQGRHQEGTRLVAQAVDNLRRHFPADLAGEASLLVEHAECLMLGGDWDAAAQALEALDTSRFEPTSDLLLRRLALLAELETLRGRWRTAMSRWRAVVAQVQAHYGPDSAVTAKYRLRYAEVLGQLGQRSAARQQLQQAGAVLERELVPGAALRARYEELRRRL